MFLWYQMGSDFISKFESSNTHWYVTRFEGVIHLHYFYVFQIKSLPKPWGSCVDISMDHYPIYSIDACHDACFTDYIIKACGCKEIYMRSNVSTCTPRQERDCVVAERDKYSKHKPPCRYSTDSNSLCPLPCKYYGYSTTLSMAHFSDAYADELSLMHGESPQYWRENGLVVNIYFQSMFQVSLEV